MAFDQISMPMDLRPLNLPRTTAEEPRILPSAATTGRNVEGCFPNPARDAASPTAMPVYYPATVPDSGFVGLPYGNTCPQSVAWCPRIPTSAGHPTIVNSTSEVSSNPKLGAPIGSSAASLTSSEGGDDSVSGKKVKFMCSFGGKILPRPSDGILRYVGGQTRIVSVRKDVSFNEFVQKMVDTCGQPVVIKYQLPGEDLDALISVSCPDDFENMREEYEKLAQKSSDGSFKLRLFLFSASELEPPGMVQFGDLQDNGQRYVDAVNGVADGFVGGITRKESVASVASTQNSDLSGNEAIDSSSTGQGDVNGPPLSNIPSPQGNTATFNDTALKLVTTEPNAAAYAASSVSFGIPVKSTPHPLPSQLESEMERSVPVTVQPPVGINLQQTGVGVPPPAPYLPSYVDSHSGGINRAEILQLPPHMVYANPQVLGTVGSVFTQPQLRDSAASISTHQYVAVPQMTIAPSSSNIGVEPNVLQPLMQPQQTRLDTIPKETTLGPKVVQLPGNQSYGAYQTHLSPAVLGGGYAWQQAPLSGHVVLPDGWLTQQQDQKKGGTSTVSDLNPAYHSLQPEDNKRSWPVNRVIVTGGLGDVNIDKHGAGVLPKVLGHLENHGVPPVEAIPLSQNLEAQRDSERIMPPKGDIADHSAHTIPYGVTGLAGDIRTPYGALTGTIPRSFQGEPMPQASIPKHYQVKQDAFLNKPTTSDSPNIGDVPLQSAEHKGYESPKAYSRKAPGTVPNDNLVACSTSRDNWLPINGKIETLHIHGISDGNEQIRPPVDVPRKEEILDHRQQQVLKGDWPIDSTSLRPKAVLNANQSKAAEMPVYSDTLYLHDLPPVEPYQMGRQPIFDSMIGGNNPTSDDPLSSGVDLTDWTDQSTLITEWKDNAWQFQPKLVPNNAENVPSNVTTAMLTPGPTSSLSGDIQDSSDSLFNIHGPWNFCHDSHLLPPKPTKITTKKEALGAKDSETLFCNTAELNSEVQLEAEAQQPQANLNRDFSSDHVNPVKDELNGQELQGVAVDVAASVLQSSTSSHADLTVNEIDESIAERNRNAEVQDKLRPKAKVEDIKTKLSEKVNLGFPVLDSLGRLQIIKNDDLEELRELGSGTFGTVYHGKWRGSDVAIKRINDRCFAGKPSEQERMRDDFWNEAIKLADLHHPNVVAFYGVVLDGPGGSVATVTEYMVNGSLRNALQKNEKNLDKRKRLLIAMDVAFGMEYLHQKNIVHFDLKSDNLLVNLRDPHRPICKVGDLGLSKVKCHTLISGGVRGTLPWMAPELLNGSSSLVSEKVDVFSFGIVLWELLTGEEPYADLHYGAIIGGIVSNTLRPHVPESCDQEWRLLMEGCWSAEPSERPSFTDIVNQLRSMAAKIPPKGQPIQQPQLQVPK